MQTDENKELIRRWIAFANAGFPGTPGAFDEFIAADYVGHLGWGELDLLRLMRQLRSAG